MIQLRKGDILKADAEALVNTVNCVGIMGRGIALQFSKAFPECFRSYKALCDRKGLQPGTMHVCDLNRLENPRFVVNFPTKRHWKGKSKIEDIEAGLKALVELVRQKQIRSVAVPPLGCGLGGLEWEEVRPMIERAFAAMEDVQVLLYEPRGAPAAEEMPKAKIAPNMTVGRAALLGLMRRYLAALMDPFVTLLEIHKLMYFMQEAGQPLRLDYEKAKYGPYATNLRHVLDRMEGHYIAGYGDAEDNPEKQIELTPAAEQADAFLAQDADTVSRFDRVVDLIAGFETPFGMELLATVHWVGTREGARTPEQAATKTYAWSDRKAMFKPEHVRKAWDVLQRNGWLSTK